MKLKQIPRRLIYVGLGLGVVVLIIAALRPSPMRVDVAYVEQGSLQVTVNEEGQTRIQSRYVVAAPVAGRLNRITLRAGAPVEAGMVVARIDPLPLDSEVNAALARLEELQAQRQGVATLRPKPEALAQVEARIRAAQATQQQAEATVNRAQAALEQASRDRQRSQALYSDGAIARQDLEAAQLRETTQAQELDVAQQAANAAAANVAAIQDELAQLQAERSDPDYLLNVYDAQIAQVEARLANLADEATQTTIVAPVAGRVLRVMEESARFVEAGAPLLEVGNLDELELVIDVLSTDAVAIAPGNPILIEHWGGDRPLRAEVRLIEPAAFTKVSALGVEEQRVNVIADFVEPPIALGDGYRVEAQIVTWENPDTLKVPLNALFRCNADRAIATEQAWCVFAIANGQAQQRQIEIGHRSSLEAEVRQGLSVGEAVILHPTEQIATGTRVTF